MAGPPLSGPSAWAAAGSVLRQTWSPPSSR